MPRGVCCHAAVILLAITAATALTQSGRKDSVQSQKTQHTGVASQFSEDLRRREVQLRQQDVDGVHNIKGNAREVGAVKEHYVPGTFRLARAESDQKSIVNRVQNMMANLQRLRAERRAKMQEAAAAFQESQRAMREAKQAEIDAKQAGKAMNEAEEEAEDPLASKAEVQEDLQEMSKEQHSAEDHLAKAAQLVDADKAASPAPAPAAASTNVDSSEATDNADVQQVHQGVAVPDSPAHQQASIDDDSGLGDVEEAEAKKQLSSHTVPDMPQEKAPTGFWNNFWDSLTQSWLSLGPPWLRRLLVALLFFFLILGIVVAIFAIWRLEQAHQKASSLNTAASGVVAAQRGIPSAASYSGNSRQRSYSPAVSHTSRGTSVQSIPRSIPRSHPSSVPPSPVLSRRGGSIPAGRLDPPVVMGGPRGGASPGSGAKMAPRPAAG
mmetsp:Transcript_52620/g.125697  ORF Transcript_52620/g.125697 Transcript_52620/m.125697 type:complete len:438 (+) Transcript_52620:109-1422(+)